MPKGAWTPPDAGDAPAEVKNILARVYSDFRDENPAEDPDVKAKGAQIAWGAVKRAGWEKDADGKWIKKSSKEVYEGPVMRFREVSGKEAGLIDVHIIRPGRGSSGYYKESVLEKACNSGVYHAGMHMHWDHPTLKQEQDQPARTLTTLAGVFQDSAHYEKNGWDGPGAYARAKIFPEFLSKVKALGGHIGISHYVSGNAEQGEAPDGKHGMIITELLADPLNTVDFVTVPGAGGSYRTMFSEAKGIRHIENTDDGNMSDKQESLTLAEIRTNHPEVFDEMKKHLMEELKVETVTKDQTAKLVEAAGKIKVLEQENKDLKKKLGEKAARDFVAAEITKAKMPEASGKVLTETLVKEIIFAEDGTIDAVAYGKIVTEAIKAKNDEIAAIRKEAGITGNGPGVPPADGVTLKESFKMTYLRQGMPEAKAEQMAVLAAAGR